MCISFIQKNFYFLFFGFYKNFFTIIFFLKNIKIIVRIIFFGAALLFFRTKGTFYNIKKSLL